MKTIKDYMFMCIKAHHESIHRLTYDRNFDTFICVLTSVSMTGIAYDMIERGLY